MEKFLIIYNLNLFHNSDDGDQTLLGGKTCSSEPQQTAQTLVFCLQGVSTRSM